MKVRTKVWIDDEEDKLIFGRGRKSMLEAIDRMGSMNKAAKALKMSYRAMWGRIKSTEDRMGTRLLKTRPGGGKRHGSTLTPVGRQLLVRYEFLEERIMQFADEAFSEIFGDMIGHEE